MAHPRRLVKSVAPVQLRCSVGSPVTTLQREELQKTTYECWMLSHQLSQSIKPCGPIGQGGGRHTAKVQDEPLKRGDLRSGHNLWISPPV